MHATMSVILAAVIVFFLCLVVVVIYCTSEQRRKTKRKHAKRLSRDEGKRATKDNNRENQIITENSNRFKPDNQTTRNVSRYDGSNHERISLLNVSLRSYLNTDGATTVVQFVGSGTLFPDLDNFDQHRSIYLKPLTATIFSY